MTYFVLCDVPNDTDVFISDIPVGLERKYELLQGKSRIESWPEDVTFRCSDYRPEGMVLTDYVRNVFSLLIVSNRFKEILEEFSLENVEYLPVSVVDHKGKPMADDYWIVNLLELTEAVDRERSEYVEDAAFEDQIALFETFVVNDGIATSGAPILRMKEAPTLVLLRDDLVAAIGKQQLTGMSFVETAEYNSLDV